MIGIQLIAFFTALTVCTILNFFLGGYFLKLDIFPALLVFNVLNTSYGRSYVIALLFGIIFGALEGQMLAYIFSALIINLLLQKGKHHFLLDAPSFLLNFSLVYLVLKTLVYFLYVSRISKLTLLMVSEYAFNTLINVFFAYPAYVAIKGLYQSFMKAYEKSLRYT